jgi:hypothetical protein
VYQGVTLQAEHSLGSNQWNAFGWESGPYSYLVALRGAITRVVDARRHHRC